MEQFHTMSGYSYYEPSYDSYYESYNVGWEDYPSHGYGTCQEFTQNSYHQWMQSPFYSTPQDSPIEEVFYSQSNNYVLFQQETRESLRNLEYQVGELLSSLKELVESKKLPLQEMVNIEENSAIAMEIEDETMAKDIEVDVFLDDTTSSEKVNTELLNSDSTNIIVSSFPFRLAKQNVEQANKSLFKDVALAKNDTSSPKASVGEVSIAPQDTPTLNYGDAILETHANSGSVIDNCFGLGNPDFIGIDRFLHIGAELNGEWVDMNKFFDVQEDKKKLGKFEDSPSIIMRLKAKLDCKMRSFHQPVTATTMALAILAIDGIENFQI